MARGNELAAEKCKVEGLAARTHSLDSFRSCGWGCCGPAVAGPRALSRTVGHDLHPTDADDPGSADLLGAGGRLGGERTAAIRSQDRLKFLRL